MLARSSARRALAAAVVILAALAGCSSSEQVSRPQPAPAPTKDSRTEITFAVYGAKPVTDAYRRLAAAYTAKHPSVKVDVQAYGSHDEALAAIRSGTTIGHAPDLFLMDRDDLASLTADKALRRVDDLLAAREVDFGDGYTRNGLEAFASDSALQCMPQSVSPMVVYYNPQLIELDKIADPGTRPVDQQGGWSLDEFKRAAAQARRPGVRGLYVAPELQQVAPFIWSGGGDVVDDTNDPTTLTLSDGASASAMERLLEIVRDPSLTFGAQALSRRPALQRFEDGKLGMMLGYRDLTPELRKHPHLIFDVMPMPRLGSGATIGHMTGLCISSTSEHAEATADFLAELISDRDASVLAATGYVMPSNLEVLNGDSFLQSGLRPLHSDVFTRELRRMRMLPNVPRMGDVSQATSHQLDQLFYEPVILPLQQRLEAIDAASVPMFAPDETTPSPSGTASPSASPSPSPSGP